MEYPNLSPVINKLINNARIPLFDSGRNEMVLLASCCHRTGYCINCNTDDGHEYSKRLVSNVRDFSTST